MKQSNFKESRLKEFRDKFNCGLICDSSGSYDDQFKEVEQFLSETIDMAEEKIIDEILIGIEYPITKYKRKIFKLNKKGLIEYIKSLSPKE